MVATHPIQAISFEGDQLCIRVGDRTVKLPLANVSKKLEAANDVQRNLYSISPSGYGIHWPLIDEDLAVGSLLDAFDPDKHA